MSHFSKARAHGAEEVDVQKDLFAGFLYAARVVFFSFSGSAAGPGAGCRSSACRGRSCRRPRRCRRPRSPRSRSSPPPPTRGEWQGWFAARTHTPNTSAKPTAPRRRRCRAHRASRPSIRTSWARRRRSRPPAVHTAPPPPCLGPKGRYGRVSFFTHTRWRWGEGQAGPSRLHV